MDNEELDIVELENENGETLRLLVDRYFYYNGEEFVLLTDDLTGDMGEEASRYIMRVREVEGEEDMEEFEPIDDDALYEKLQNAVQTVLDEEFDDLDDD